MPTVRRCCIIGCASNSREKPQLQFFQFPKPEHPFHKLWLQACHASLNRILPFKKPVVCALHFHPKNLGGRRLTGNAIPCMRLDVPSNLRALEQQNMAQEIERSRKYLFLNAVVYEWLVRSNLNPNIRGSVTHGMIKEKAEIAKNIIGLDTFVADNRWLNSFRETQLKGFAAKLAGNQLEPQGGNSLVIPDIIKDLEHLYPPANADHIENVPEQYLNFIQQQYGEYDEADDDAADDDEKERQNMQTHTMNNIINNNNNNNTNNMNNFHNNNNYNTNHYNTTSQMHQDYSYNSIYHNNNNHMYNSNSSYNNYNANNSAYNNYNHNNNFYNNVASYNNANNFGYNNNNNNINYQQHHHQQPQQQHHHQQNMNNTYFNALTQKYTVTSAAFEGHSDSNYSSPQYSNTSQSPPAPSTTHSQAQPAKRQKLDLKSPTKINADEPKQICETVCIEDDDVEFVHETKPRLVAEQQPGSETSANKPSPKPQDINSSEPKTKALEQNSPSPKCASSSPQLKDMPSQKLKNNAILRLKSSLQANNNFSTERETKKPTVLSNCKTLQNYEDALAYLKPLEDFVLIKENFRAIGLLSQFEIILRRGIAATSTEREQIAAEDQ